MNLFAPGAEVADRVALERTPRRSRARRSATGSSSASPFTTTIAGTRSSRWWPTSACRSSRWPSAARRSPRSSDSTRPDAAVWVTVTTPAEAATAQAAGADALVVQGVEAGGHRGSFDQSRAGRPGRACAAAARARGHRAPACCHRRYRHGPRHRGGAGGRRCAAQLGSGVHARPRGRHLARAPRGAARWPRHRAHSRVHGPHRPRDQNRFMREHEADAPHGYPEVHHLTAPVRVAAREGGDAEGFHLWAGQAHPLARSCRRASSSGGWRARPARRCGQPSSERLSPPSPRSSA